jgi:hypothetical protein
MGKSYEWWISSNHLGELGEEVGRVRADLADGECDEHGGEEVGNGEVEERVLWQPAAALQHGEDNRPRAQEHQRHAHQADGAADVLHQVHLPGSPHLMMQSKNGVRNAEPRQFRIQRMHQ